jgi:hypothetical protein
MDGTALQCDDGQEFMRGSELGGPGCEGPAVSLLIILAEEPAYIERL